MTLGHAFAPHELCIVHDCTNCLGLGLMRAAVRERRFDLAIDLYEVLVVHLKIPEAVAAASRANLANARAAFDVRTN